MPTDSVWGASIRIQMAFRDRSRFLASVRHLIADVCTEYLDPCESTFHLQMVVNELLENIVKYSSDGRGIMEFDLTIKGDVPMARISTQNTAAPEHWVAAIKRLDEVNAAADPVRVYNAMIATSGERPGSGLGLTRIRAEAGFGLSYRTDGDQLGLEAIGPVVAKATER